ncbi:hypothetical protein [Xylanibacter muris]|uniref:Uncharacterized protein n=1 Tax=Xylanibacter muris TaxID=2736290 RepID=A0ABX2AQL8_9BACT|nr:hypothetical protein [Xylanibacter muris]NPD93264.1 hypothetical protein [Xylanibacter muris]
MKITITLFLASIITNIIQAQDIKPETTIDETVYMHLDNNGYFLNENIWFAAYTTDSQTNGSENSTKTLYVELLAPEGYVVKTQKYKMENGKCNGTIKLTPSLLSGLYEIRAYTKSMAIKSNPCYFSQVIPVYDENKNGDYSHRSIFARERNTKTTRKTVNALKMPCTNTKEQLAISYDTTQVKPFGKITIKIKGKPNYCYSIAVTDRKNMINTYGYKPALWTTKLEREKYKPLMEAELTPPARTYTNEEISLINIACKERMLCTIKKPIKPGNKEVIGLTHSSIHSSMDDALKLIKGKGFKEPTLRTETGWKSVALILELLLHWDYPYDMPFRVISIDGDYCGDRCIPEAKEIFDGPGFNYKDYKEIIIRTDSAICNAYGYAERPIKRIMNKATSSGFNARTSNHLGKPGIVVCLVSKTKEEDEKEIVNNNNSNRYEKYVAFPMPYYSNNTDSKDHRRTLYWNPNVRTDSKGKAKISFYNNSTCTGFAVSAEGITENGKPVVY